MSKFYFNKNLKFLREKLGLSKESLGKALGFKRGLISSYEAQENNSFPKLENLDLIISYLTEGNSRIDIKTIIYEDYSQDQGFMFDADKVLDVLKIKSKSSNQKHIDTVLYKNVKLDTVGLLDEIEKALSNSEEYVSFPIKRAQRMYNNWSKFLMSTTP